MTSHVDVIGFGFLGGLLYTIPNSFVIRFAFSETQGMKPKTTKSTSQALWLCCVLADLGPRGCGWDPAPKLEGPHGSPWVPRSRQLRGKFSTMLRSLGRRCAAVHQQWPWLGTWASDGEWYGSHGFLQNWGCPKMDQFLICGECEFSKRWILAANAKHPLGNLGMCWICFCCGLVCWGLRFGGMDCSPYCRSFSHLSQYLIDRWSAFLAGQLIIVFSYYLTPGKFQNKYMSRCHLQ
jgi:hypothetical protein